MGFNHHVPAPGSDVERVTCLQQCMLLRKACWEMLMQRTRVHCWATPQRFPYSPSFQALTIYTPRLSRLKNFPASGTPSSDPDSQHNLQLQPNACHVFSARIQHFGNLLRRPFPRLFLFLLQFDLWKTFFADLFQNPNADIRHLLDFLVPSLAVYATAFGSRLSLVYRVLQCQVGRHGRPFKSTLA